ncbi:PriCT-2 domain-containing protein, partial [Thiotrichales bacterium 19S9-12]|nr:PriCT-2 domain-containing protein [Thiotrichales bacterium 19S9-11]MCF6808385.1 PriCT-2 domain-containing protein [Thiotrichales bacterium 19S9-11]MCF6811850.1 PriCT-2 domain-containing protein [Thiotrichales bacterium 19S9-12]MCF6812210.1 PriCT-2 domain-containing protein [Thiotrichales bacterium 19S9-12]
MDANQIDKIKNALAHISPDCSRNEWVEIAMAIKSEVDSEVGFELFNNWSSLSEKYNQKDTASTW